MKYCWKKQKRGKKVPNYYKEKYKWKNISKSKIKRNLQTI